MDSYQLQQRIDEAVADLDADALSDLLKETYKESDAPPAPFDAKIELRPEVRRELADAALESDAAMRWANRIERARRWVTFQLKVAAGFDGLVVVDEGDSWFQYPLLLKDTIDFLSADDDKALLSLSAAGDVLEDMSRRSEYRSALEQSGATVMLLSGGGNDLLGGGQFATILLPFSSGRSARDLIATDVFERQVAQTLGSYRSILADVATRFPSVRILGHAYDLPHPHPDGRWLGIPLKQRGIPDEVGRDVVRIVLDRFSQELKKLQAEFANYHFVDLQGVVGRGRSSWFDELHPKEAGYGRVAEAFRDALAELGRQGALERRVAPADLEAARPALAPSGLEHARRGVIVLDPGHGGSTPPPTVGGSSWNNAIGPNGTLEKTLTLDVARRAQAVLTGRGHRVILTREDDTNPGLSARAGVAKANGAAAFVSIHFNASTGHNAQGTETFVHEQHNEASRRLGVLVQAHMVAALGLRDRNDGHPGGVKQGRFGVLNPGSHAASTARVLHEVSFLDRADEEARLITSSYRDRISEALADGIEAYLDDTLDRGAPELEMDVVGIGDAIELAAAEAGVGVIAHLGFAESGTLLHATAGEHPAPSVAASASLGARAHVGGHALPSDLGATRTSGESLLQQISQSLANLRSSHLGPADTQDRREFSTVDIGAPLDVEALTGPFESSGDLLQRSFADFERDGFEFNRFESMILGLGLRHFAAPEFLFMGSSNQPGASCSGRNSPPPESLWPNILATAAMLDEIRHRLGASVHVLSCYRSPSYNSCVGGERASLHMRFNAIDWKCDAGTVGDWHRVAKEVRAGNPRFEGGVGSYPSRGFVHIDTRGSRADWTG